MTSSTTLVRRTQEQRRADAEEALLDAATNLFARKGVEPTSLADVGLEAGYSRGLVNHHFGSRAALVESLAMRSQQRVAADLGSEGVGVEEVLRLADAYLERLPRATTESRAFFVMWGSSFAEESPLRDIFVDGDARFRHGVESLVSAGKEAGALRRDVDPSGFSLALVALLRGIGAQYVVAPEAIDLAAARKTCRALVRAFLEPAAQERETQATDPEAT